MKTLVLEQKKQPDTTLIHGNVAITPKINKDYWEYRVKLTDTQAIVGFPKFFTIGVGFAGEEDRNTNLPYTCEAEKIYDHIKNNKGDRGISRKDCIAAIRLIQKAAASDQHAA